MPDLFLSFAIVILIVITVHVNAAAPIETHWPDVITEL